MLRRAWQAYERVLERRPISVKVATASTLWCASDVLAQRLERRAGKPPSKLARTWGPDGELDWPRTASYVAFGAAYTALFQHWWLAHLAHRFPLPAAGSGAAAVARPVAMRLLCNNFLMVPIAYFPTFFVGTTVARGGTFAEGVDTLRDRLAPTLTANLALWVPAQALQFAVIPLRHQILFVSVIGFGWQTVLSLMAEPSAAPAAAADDDGTAAGARSHAAPAWRG